MSEYHVDLSPILRAVNQVETRLGNQIDGVGTEVGFVRQDLNLTQTELSELRAKFDEFAQASVQRHNVQHSTTVVGNLKAELDRQFGHYGEVRKTSTGMLQAFDVGNVSNQTVQTVSEELMIQTPRYWLAPSVVALAAWSRDDQEMAQKSVHEAYARDKNKAALFFALVLRRQQRLDASTRWLKHYLTSLDPRALTREFAVILEAVSHNAFGTAAQVMLSKTMEKWVTELRTRDDIIEAQIRKWIGELQILSRKVDANEYMTLATLGSAEWPQLRRQLEQASALPEFVQKYAGVRDSAVGVSSSLEDALDDLLDQLVTNYDDEELPLKREVVYHEAVIEEAGDLSRARTKADQLQAALDETHDVVTLQTMAALEPENLGVSQQTQRIAVGIGQSDVQSALNRFCADYRSQAIHDLDLLFSADHSTRAQALGFTGVTVSSREPEPTALGKINEAWRNTLTGRLESVRFKNSWYVKPSIIAFVGVVILFAMNPIVGIVGVLGAAVIVYLLGESARKKAQKAEAEILEAGHHAQELSFQMYREAIAQLVDARLLYQELDQKEAEARQLIDTWPTTRREETEG